MRNKEFLSTIELAEILGISRIAVFKQIKNGKIKAKKVGRNFIISKKEADRLSNKTIDDKTKKTIKKAVNKVVKEYGETLKMFGNE